MPTIHRERGFRFVVYPNDHEPAHVHAVKADGEAKITILSEVDFISVVGLSDKDAVRALEITERLQAQFLAKWEGIHSHEKSKK